MQAIIRMYDGRMVDVFNLQPDDIRPHNFIHAICNINRYTGHLPFPISVGLHSLKMAAHVPYILKRAALIHDWTEACFNDIATPIKAQFADYKVREKAAEKIICETMRVSLAEIAMVKPYDKRIRQDERIATWGYENWKDDKWTYDGDAQPLNIYFVEQYWRDVRDEYTEYFEQLFPEWSPIRWQ